MGIILVRYRNWQRSPTAEAVIGIFQLEWEIAHVGPDIFDDFGIGGPMSSTISTREDS